MPGMRVRNVDRIESSSKSGIDIRAGRIAYHPGALWINLQLAYDTMIGGNVFFWHDHYLLEVFLNSRPLNLELLFFAIAFGEQEQVVSRREIGQCLFDSLKKLQGLSANLLSETTNLLDILFLQVFFGKATIGFDQALREISRSITHQSFNLIQHRSNLLTRESRMVKECHERVNSLLKINIVLPKGIIGIHNEVVSHMLFDPS